MDKSTRINKFINITLLIFVILVSITYTYMTLPTFFQDEEVVEQEVVATTTVMTEQEKKGVFTEVVDPVEVDESGLLNVLKSVPQTTKNKPLSNKEKMNILEGI